MDDAEFRALQGQFGLPPGYRGAEVAQPAGVRAPVMEMQLHPAAAALGATTFPTFKFMVESRLGGQPAPPGFDVRRFCQSPMTGFYALRVELSCSCTHAGVHFDLAFRLIPESQV